MLQKLLERLFGVIRGVRAITSQAWGLSVQTADHLLPQHPTHRKWVIVGFFSMPVLGAVVAVAGSVEHLREEVPVAHNLLVVESIPLNVQELAVMPAQPLVAQEQIRRGDTIVSILERLDLNDSDLRNFLSTDDVGRKLFQLRAGRYIHVQVSPEGQLDWMRYKINKETDYVESLLVTRTGEGYEASIQKLDFDVEPAVRAGRIESSLFGAADKADLPEAIAVQMAEIFSSDIDFHRELRNGDEFRVVYEQMSLDGEIKGSGRVLAVEFVNNGDVHQAYYFEQKNGDGGYYNADGISKKRSFLRSPLKFSRVSSGFTKRRFHPIQKRWKAHHGVDYAAPTGTPIMATANGRVEFVGVKGGYGNIVILRHSNGITTRYAHLSRFGKGIRVGDRIQQGDLIGYVGATGWATGPHLHYEFRVNDDPKDPLSVKVAETADPLESSDLALFRAARTGLDQQLAMAETLRLAAREDF